MKILRRLLGLALSAGIAGARHHGRVQRSPLKRLRVVHDWMAGPDGAPRPLGPDETITVTRTGTFADRDPLKVNDGWRDGVSFTTRATWLVVISAAATLGWFRGRGPLAALRSYRQRSSSRQASE